MIKKNQAKFQGQKIHEKKVIQNLPTLVVVVESFSLLPTLTTSQRLHYFLFAMKFLEKNIFMLLTYGKNFKAKKLIGKYILTIYQHV
jgi:hypothetical protein